MDRGCFSGWSCVSGQCTAVGWTVKRSNQVEGSNFALVRALLPRSSAIHVRSSVGYSTASRVVRTKRGAPYPVLRWTVYWCVRRYLAAGPFPRTNPYLMPSGGRLSLSENMEA